MAAFPSFYTILPDSNHKIGLAGQADASGTAGPGYSEVSFRASQPVAQSMYNSRRFNNTDNYPHKWELDISYNKLTCPEFHAIYAFLLLKQETLEPFFVSLAQYYSQNITNKTVVSGGAEGSDKITVTGTDIVPGMVFVENVASHQKIYVVTRVETASDYFTPDGAPAAGDSRLHVSPKFEQSVTNALKFTDPLLKVRLASDTLEYSIDPEGLFSFSLKLREF